MNATVYSTYMNNINDDVVKKQRACVEKFLPKGWKFKQVCHSMTHGQALRKCVDDNKNEITVFLDIDCIPLSPISFTYLLDPRWQLVSGGLVGAAQRANHIKNNGHIYVGPFCMAFMNSAYWEVGGPTFSDTPRGDVGEELTYAWQAENKPVFFLYPSDVEKPLWDLLSGIHFGIGTTYENLFYHSFCIRSAGYPESSFLRKCDQVLALHKSRMKEREAVAQ